MSSYDQIKAECYEANLLLPEFKLIDLTFGGEVTQATGDKRLLLTATVPIDTAMFSNQRICLV